MISLSNPVLKYYLLKKQGKISEERSMLEGQHIIIYKLETVYTAWQKDYVPQPGFIVWSDTYQDLAIVTTKTLQRVLKSVFLHSLHNDCDINSKE